MMLGHMSFGVDDLARSAEFYDEIFAPLDMPGFGQSKGPPVLDFISLSTHRVRDAVDRFHAADLRAGGSDCGRPGPRLQYGATYYAALVLDPDGYKLEAIHQ